MKSPFEMRSLARQNHWMKQLSGALVVVLAALPCNAIENPDLKYYNWRESTLTRISEADCASALKKAEVAFERKKSFVAERVCDAKNLVLVSQIRGVTITPKALMTCDLALKLANWMKSSIQPEAKKLGSEISAIRQSGTFSCRKMRTLDFISEHAFANAIDLPEFRFKNGTKITVIKNWKRPAKESAFLQAIHKSACGLFPVALGPEYDKHHENHLHVDVGPLTLCK